VENQSVWGRGIERRSRRVAKAGARSDELRQLFCIRPAMEASANGRPSFVLFVQGGGLGLRVSIAPTKEKRRKSCTQPG
jgi:hypothetical protein